MAGNAPPASNTVQEEQERQGVPNEEGESPRGELRPQTLVVFRHGEGQHQVSESYPKELGPKLTANGKRQAEGVRDDAVFERSLTEAKRPFFVASNLIRAVETMAVAAPAATVVVQPLARELIKVSCDLPSSRLALESWARAEGVELDLSPYLRELLTFGVSDHAQYVARLRRADGGGTWETFHKGCKTLPGRAGRLVSWMSEQDADVVFLAAHGDFLLEGLQAVVRTEDGAAAVSSSGWDNCEVREYSFVRSSHGVWLSPRAADSDSDFEKAPRGGWELDVDLDQRPLLDSGLDGNPSVGSLVELHGLSGFLSEYNGRIGAVRVWVPERGRLEIDIGGDDIVEVKPDQLTVVPPLASLRQPKPAGVVAADHDAAVAMTALLEQLPGGSKVAIVSMLGSLCPITLGHVRCYEEARRLLLKHEPSVPRPEGLEDFAECLGFVYLNADGFVGSKLRRRGERALDYKQRSDLVRLATVELPWLRFCGSSTFEDQLSQAHPSLDFVKYDMNGADDVARYRKWGRASETHRMITIGRPGSTEEVRSGIAEAVARGSCAPEHCLLGPELPDISSTSAREASAAGDREALLEILHPSVADWLLCNDGHDALVREAADARAAAGAQSQ